jgi:hypothetical protein
VRRAEGEDGALRQRQARGPAATVAPMGEQQVTRGLVRLVGVLLLLGLSACGGGCAGRRSTDGGAAPAPVEAEDTPAVETAEEAPAAPVVPPELVCATDVDCTATPFARPVASRGGCYCPTCPQPLAVDAAATHEEAWQTLCGAAWEASARCEAPMCPRPPPVVCREGACVAATGS